MKIKLYLSCHPEEHKQAYIIWMGSDSTLQIDFVPTKSTCKYMKFSIINFLLPFSSVEL